MCMNRCLHCQQLTAAIASPSTSCALLLLLPVMLPPVQPANLGSGRPRPAWMNLQRITGFGPWGPTAGCQVRRLLHLPAACPATSGMQCEDLLLMSLS